MATIEPMKIYASGYGFHDHPPKARTQPKTPVPMTRAARRIARSFQVAQRTRTSPEAALDFFHCVHPQTAATMMTTCREALPPRPAETLAEKSRVRSSWGGSQHASVLSGSLESGRQSRFLPEGTGGGQGGSLFRKAACSLFSRLGMENGTTGGREGETAGHPARFRKCDSKGSRETVGNFVEKCRRLSLVIRRILTKNAAVCPYNVPIPNRR